MTSEEKKTTRMPRSSANPYSAHAAKLMDVYAQRIRPIRTRTPRCWGAAIAAIKRVSAMDVCARETDPVAAAAALIAEAIDAYSQSAWHREQPARRFKAFELLCAPGELDNKWLEVAIAARKKSHPADLPPVIRRARDLAPQVQKIPLVQRIFVLLATGRDPNEIYSLDPQAAQCHERVTAIERRGGPPYQQFSELSSAIAEIFHGGTVPGAGAKGRACRLAAELGLAAHGFTPLPLQREDPAERAAIADRQHKRLESLSRSLSSLATPHSPLPTPHSLLSSESAPC